VADIFPATSALSETLAAEAALCLAAPLCRLVTRWEYYVESFFGMVRLGCMRILFSICERILAPVAPLGRARPSCDPDNPNDTCALTLRDAGRRTTVHRFGKRRESQDPSKMKYVGDCGASLRFVSASTCMVSFTGNISSWFAFSIIALSMLCS
jgi:hypothetical protein